MPKGKKSVGSGKRRTRPTVSTKVVVVGDGGNGQRTTTRKIVRSKQKRKEALNPSSSDTRAET